MKDSKNLQPKVAVMVLNWNRLEETSACCRSLSKLDYPRFDICVVDNGSTAHSIEALERACPGAAVLRLSENRGFAGGVNAGIRAALERSGYEYIWLLNNDALCDSNALSRMVDVAAASRECAIVGCLIKEGVGGSYQKIYSGMRLQAPLYLPFEAKADELFDYISGASMLIKCTALEQIGLLDEGFFFFFEDVDFCLRAVKQGWKIGLAKNAMIYHEGSATIGKLSGLRAMYYRAGHVRLLRKHVKHPFWPAFLCLNWRLVNDLLRGQWASIRGSLKGWRQGWTSSL